ncbi:uncharacterized protein [Macrobrachium rosenbergii]|uniref:uncharacterized protein isoform X2 n=1 Tax=Macrobrachium rosenbergii TaxID=79674 RepID=UPI0034D6623E
MTAAGRSCERRVLPGIPSNSKCGDKMAALSVFIMATFFASFDSDCPVPKDCSQVLDVPNAHGIYKISPAERTDLGIMANCMNFGGDGGWTLVARQNSSNPDAYNETLLIKGFGVLPNESVNYFIGMHYLVAINQKSTLEPRPLVFLFVIEDGVKGTVVATYSDVTISNDTFKVTVGGKFFGDAGNCWKDLSSTALHPPDAKSECSVLKFPLSWAALTSIKKISLYVRPKEYDSGVACPVFPFDSHDFPNVKLVFPTDRLPMMNITYICPEQFVEQSNITETGNVTCVKDASSGSLSWNRELVFPCKLHCPTNFIATPNETHCLGFTESPETFGVHSASLRCRDMNASLNLLTVTDELTVVPKDKLFFTGHYVISPGNVTMDPSNLTYSCLNATECLDNSTGKCLMTTKDGYQMVDCANTTLMAMCRLPALCPPGYTRYRFLCYRLICETIPRSVSYYLEKCRSEGSAMAYPETKDVLDALLRMLAGMNSTASHIELGLNDITGDWGQGGLYKLDADMKGAVGMSSGGKNYRKLMVDPPGELQGRSYIEFLVGCGACQYLALADCWRDPLPPMENMARMWDGKKDLKTVTTYNCYPGYYMGGRLTSTSLMFTCLGQLGSWFSMFPLENCTPVNVCNQLPPPPHPEAVVTETNTSRFLNGTVSFKCPGNLATAAGLVVQNATCVGSPGMFSFSPATLEPCHEICAVMPTLTNATADWNSSAIYIKGSVIAGTCDPGYNFEPGQAEKNMTCLAEDQWDNLTCYEACVGDLPMAGSNMTADNITANELGSILYFTCDDGTYTSVNETYPVPMNATPVECSPEALWIPQGPLTCEELCLDDPPSGEPPFASDWNNVSRAYNTTVTITCVGLFLLGDLNKTKTIVCQDGQWTETALNETVCVVGTLDPPSTPVPGNIGAVMEGPSPPYLEGDQMNFTCMEGKLAPMGVTFYTVNFTADGWTKVDPGFICYNVSYDPPVINVTAGEPGILSLPPTPFFVGSVANYTCPGDSMTPDGLTFCELVYQPDGWSPVPKGFVCYNMTFLPPALPSFALGVGTLTGPDPPYHVGQKLAYKCFTGYVSTKLDAAGQVVHVTYVEFLGGDKWSPLDPQFICVVG